MEGYLTPTDLTCSRPAYMARTVAELSLEPSTLHYRSRDYSTRMYGAISGGKGESLLCLGFEKQPTDLLEAARLYTVSVGPSAGSRSADSITPLRAIPDGEGQDLNNSFPISINTFW
ncbi:hypothetical protein AVEN_159058-1 [Araneus ventricosus]|uniref:Uncharacterized protein n=1 Tax=Araneus ventricosus TaxID=182803 RepID=A0A4Y2B8U9_ARAVE|nr:hypothetical protein AVEN_159058-1 [Araneus ventricosus]